MRRIAVVDAPSNLGLRPPTATSVPGCAKAPGALRDHNLLTRLGARDAGCITPPRYDPAGWQPGDGVAQSAEIAVFVKRLADRIGSILGAGDFPLVLGGDCSILLGAGLAMRRFQNEAGGRIGLVYVDAHSDFRHDGNASYVGAAAGEALALATGRGQANLASIEQRRPYFRDVDVAILGIRTHDEYRLDLQAAGIVARAVPELRSDGAARSAQWARDQLRDCAGFWVHIDVDVLDPAVMPAVDAPDVGGIAYRELEILLSGLIADRRCLGAQVTVFDPDYDPDGQYAAEVVDVLVAGLEPLITSSALAAASPDPVISAPPFAPPVSAPPVSAPPVSAPPVSAPPASAPPVSAPPISAPSLATPYPPAPPSPPSPAVSVPAPASFAEPTSPAAPGLDPVPASFAEPTSPAASGADFFAEPDPAVLGSDLVAEPTSPAASDADFFAEPDSAVFGSDLVAAPDPDFFAEPEPRAAPDVEPFAEPTVDEPDSPAAVDSPVAVPAPAIDMPSIGVPVFDIADISEMSDEGFGGEEERRPEGDEPERIFTLGGQSPNELGTGVRRGLERLRPGRQRAGGLLRRATEEAAEESRSGGLLRRVQDEAAEEPRPGGLLRRVQDETPEESRPGGLLRRVQDEAAEEPQPGGLLRRVQDETPEEPRPGGLSRQVREETAETETEEPPAGADGAEDVEPARSAEKPAWLLGRYSRSASLSLDSLPRDASGPGGLRRANGPLVPTQAARRGPDDSPESPLTDVVPAARTPVEEEETTS